MPRFLTTDAAVTTLRQLFEAGAHVAADENTLIARDEQSDLHPYLRRIADELRADGGPGARVHVDALVDRAVHDALGVWNRHNPPGPGRDSLFLSLDEIDAISDEDPDLGAFTRAVRQHVLVPSVTLGARARAWFDAFPWHAQSFVRTSLPEGRRVDARIGRPDRGLAPPEVVDAFDYYYRLEQADLGSVTLHAGALDGDVIWAVYATTDGDDRYLEVLDDGGNIVAGARFLADTVAWDTFPGHTRLARLWTSLDRYAYEEGLHEPKERLDAGQPPWGWRGAYQTLEGALHPRGALLDRVDFGASPPPDDLRDLAVAAFEYLWDVHLRHTVTGDAPVRLGHGSQGVLTVGSFARIDGTYLAADWRDIDDGSYVLYFQRTPLGLQLKIQQYDN